jgi:hypothetical protein
VAIQLNRRLSPVDLGLDPTVIFKTSKDMHFSDERATSSVLINGKEWTLLARMFQSVALIGRGTSVYLVQDEQGVRRVMKTTWRASKGPAESDHYKVIQTALSARQQSWPSGLGRIDLGENMDNASRVKGGRTLRAKKDQTGAITTDTIRKGLASVSANIQPGQYLVMHRMLFQDLGRPVWEYSEDLELVLAVRDCIQGMSVQIRAGV